MKKESYFQQTPLPDAGDDPVETETSRVLTEEHVQADGGGGGQCPGGMCGVGRVGSLLKPYRLLTGLVLILAAFVAAPVVFFHFFYPAARLGEVRLLGVNYFAAVYVYMLCAVVIMVGLIFFLRLKAKLASLFFITLLLCCIPLLVGLRNELSLSAAFCALPFFNNWPFFMRPFYVLCQGVLPLGVFLFFILQVKGLFVGKSYDYAFLVAGLFVAGASFIGLSGLSRAGHANVLTLLQPGGSMMAEVVNESPTGIRPPVPFAGPVDSLVVPDLERNEVVAGGVATVPFAANAIGTGNLITMAKDAGGEYKTVADIEQRLSRLLGAVDAKLTELDQREGQLAQRNNHAMQALENRVAALDGKLEQVLAEISAEQAVVPPGDSVVGAGGGGTRDGGGLARINHQLDELERKMAAMGGRFSAGDEKGVPE